LERFDVIPPRSSLSPRNRKGSNYRPRPLPDLTKGFAGERNNIRTNNNVGIHTKGFKALSRRILLPTGSYSTIYCGSSNQHSSQIQKGS